VNLRTGHVTRRIAVAAGPQYVSAKRDLAVVTSTAAGVVTLLAGEPLHVRAVVHGFSTPRITELSPDGHHVYVTDDARGTLTVIGLRDARVAGRVFVGAGAHHMTSSPDQTRLWIALGESAHTISIVDTADVARPAVVGRFDPGFPAHDLSFSPDGRRVWITSATGSSVAVFRARDHRLLFRVPVGPAPQHVAFDGAFAYLTSGYGRTIERVAAATGRVIERASSPYGSFEPSAGHGFVTTASLLNGQLAVFTPTLKLLRVVRVAPATRDVTIAGG
jgi:DNA-binding beta-propeller fold protein YncE